MHFIWFRLDDRDWRWQLKERRRGEFRHAPQTHMLEEACFFVVLQFFKFFGRKKKKKPGRRLLVSLQFNGLIFGVLEFRVNMKSDLFFHLCSVLKLRYNHSYSKNLLMKWFPLLVEGSLKRELIFFITWIFKSLLHALTSSRSNYFH